MIPLIPVPNADTLAGANVAQLISLIRRDLRMQGKPVPPAAAPYMDALSGMSDLSEPYMAEDGYGIANYMLGNLSTYRGEIAKLVKTEFKRRLKR